MSFLCFFIICIIFLKTLTENPRTFKERLSDFLKQLSISVIVSLLADILKPFFTIASIKIFLNFIWRVLKRIGAIGLKVLQSPGHDSIDILEKDLAELFFEVTNFVNPDIEKYIKIASKYLYVDHLFITCIIIALCFEIYILNLETQNWYLLLTQKKPLVILLLTNLFLLVAILCFATTPGRSRFNINSVILIFALIFIFGVLIWITIQADSLEQSEENSIILIINSILKTFLILLGICSLGVLG